MKASDGPKNGGAPAPSFAMAGVAASSGDDPMSKVLGLDASTSSLGAWFGFTSGSTLLMVGLMALTSVVAWLHTEGRLAATAPDEIDVMKEEAPPPPPAPKVEPEVKPEPTVPAPPRAREAPPPAPAQAAKVLTQEPDPNEPVDLTGNTIVQGNADSYAGGFTSAAGTNPNAVRTLTAPTGGTAAVPAPSRAPVGPDRSRPASVGNTDWNAPFPPEADSAQIDDANVTLEIDIRADGTPGAVRVLVDPGNGFGREARQYAMKQRYSPALDRDGHPVAETKKVRVHFSR
jgi:periplasmic protein TonB